MRQSDQLQCYKYVLYVAGVSTCPPRMSVAASYVPLTSQQLMPPYTRPRKGAGS